MQNPTRPVASRQESTRTRRWKTSPGAEFEKTLKKRKLAVYKAENSDFLKIMRYR